MSESAEIVRESEVDVESVGKENGSRYERLSAAIVDSNGSMCAQSWTAMYKRSPTADVTCYYWYCRWPELIIVPVPKNSMPNNKSCAGNLVSSPDLHNFASQ